MPNKPQKNQPKTGPENSSGDSSRSDLGDDIDDLELEPISSQLPRKKKADSIPSKPAPADSGELTDEQIDDISLEDIDKPNDNKSTRDEDTEAPADEKQKSTRRMYPSGKEVDLTSKTEETPTTAEPPLEKIEPPVAVVKTEASNLDDDIDELLIDDNPEAYAEDEGQIQESDKIDDYEPTIRQSTNVTTQKKNSMSVVEKGALGLFLLLLIVGLAIYIPQMIPQGHISNAIIDVADTPIELEDITVESLEARWTETLHIASRVRRNVKWTPEVEIAISGAGSGALRFIFLDQDGRQRGDTIDIAFENGKFQPSMQSSTKVYCTHGFTSELELKDLRARGNAWWTVRVLKGQNIKAASSEFESIIEMKIPFEIVVSEN